MKNSKSLYLMSIVVLFIFATNHLKSQNDINKGSAKNVETAYTDDEMASFRLRWDKALGSFQIQIVNSRINPQIPVSLIQEIEAARKDKETVYIKHTESIRIMILPKSVIKKDYTKLELFKYVTE